jgi:REP element-mobilizing transposase RayT
MSSGQVPSNELHSTAAGYLITFRCYGTWLHGDGRGSVDRDHREYDSPFAPASPTREKFERTRMKRAPAELCQRARQAVEHAIDQVCAYRGWELHACSARTNHVHAVITASASPERVMNSLKSWSTRSLVEQGLVVGGTRPWSRHGSTRYLWTEDQLESAWRYVVEMQDEPVAEESS